MAVSPSDMDVIQKEIDEADDNHRKFLKEENMRDFLELRDKKNYMTNQNDFNEMHKHGMDIAIEFLTRIDALEDGIGSTGVKAWWYRAKRRTHYARMFAQEE